MRIPKPIITIPAIAIVVLAALGIAAKWHLVQSNNAYCSMNLRNYNECIGSCGIDSSCYEAWKDPEKTKALVWKLFEMRVPKCPSGGTSSLVYNRGVHRWLPTLVCSMEHSHQHIDSNIAADEQRIAERARMGSAIENVEAIATRIASRIERLKAQHPQLEHFSTATCLHQTPPQQNVEPGKVESPELYSISYNNGIQLGVYFFRGPIRGGDATLGGIGTLSFRLFLTGPAAESIRRDIGKEIRHLQDEYRYDYPPIPAIEDH